MTNQKHISTVVDFPDNVSEIVIIAKIPWLRELIGILLLTL